MHFPFKKRHAFVACLLMTPLAAFATDIEINGVCVQGTCPPPSGSSDALQVGQSTSNSGSYNLNFGDGDKYLVTWSYADSFPGGTHIVVNPVATFVSGPSTSTDTISFDLFQNFYSAGAANWDGTYTQTVPLDIEGSVGSGSTASAEVFYDGQGLGEAGPFGPGYHDQATSMLLTGLDGTTLSAEYEFTYTFAPGTQSGGNASSPSVPEPSETLPLAILGVGACVFSLRGRGNFGKI